MYYEASCRIEVKPNVNKHPFNHVDLSFDHAPSYIDVKQALAERYPDYNLIEVERVWDASFKAEWLVNYYKTKRFTGD